MSRYDVVAVDGSFAVTIDGAIQYPLFATLVDAQDQAQALLSEEDRDITSGCGQPRCEVTNPAPRHTAGGCSFIQQTGEIAMTTKLTEVQAAYMHAIQTAEKFGPRSKEAADALEALDLLDRYAYEAACDEIATCILGG